MRFSDLPAQLYSVGANCTSNLVPLLARQLHVESLPSRHSSALLLKSLSVAHSVQHQVTVQLSTRTTSLKSQKSLTGTAGHSLPPPYLGTDKVPLSLSGILLVGVWHQAMDDKLLAVYKLAQPPKSLLAQVCGLPTRDCVTLPWEGREPRSCDF